MSSICQASPCTQLTNATGDTKYYKPGEGWFQKSVSTQNGVKEEKLTYCPFCGTHLIEVTAPSIVRRVDRSAPAYIPAGKYFSPAPSRPVSKPITKPQVPQLRSIPAATPVAVPPPAKVLSMAAELTSLPARPLAPPAPTKVAAPPPFPPPPKVAPAPPAKTAPPPPPLPKKAPPKAPVPPPIPNPVERAPKPVPFPPPPPRPQVASAERTVAFPPPPPRPSL